MCRHTRPSAHRCHTSAVSTLIPVVTDSSAQSMARPSLQPRTCCMLSSISASVRTTAATRMRGVPSGITSETSTLRACVGPPHNSDAHTTAKAVAFSHAAPPTRPMAPNDAPTVSDKENTPAFVTTLTTPEPPATCQPRSPSALPHDQEPHRPDSTHVSCNCPATAMRTV